MKKEVQKYLQTIYKEAVHDPIYAPEVHQSMIDFKAGYEAYRKIVRDKLNEVQSKLSEEETPKLAKTLPNVRIARYKAQKEVLEAVIKKGL